MTWEELVNFVLTLEDIGTSTGGGYIDIWVDGIDGVRFYKNGLITLILEEEPIVSKNRTPDQMYQIIKALTDTVGVE